MAEQPDRGERKIPVFSVWKNNVILKNIFLINAPPSIELELKPNQEHQPKESHRNGETHQEFEETLMVGRHPDCDIRLEHPSISRFHLRLHSIPSQALLFLTDLSSVHGTWVSGKRIEPNVRTRLTECDSLRIGGSSRIYKLLWIPLNQAYDMEHPFVPPLDFPEPHEDDEEEIIEDEISSGSKDVDVNMVKDDAVPGELSLQQENTVAVEIQDVELVNSDLVEGLGSLFVNEKSDVDISVQKEIIEAAQLQNENPQVPINKGSDSEFSFRDANSADVHLVSFVSSSVVPFENEEVVTDDVVSVGLPLHQENSAAVNNEEVELVNHYLVEGLGYWFGDESSDIFVQKEITQAAQMPNDNYQVLVNNESETKSSFQGAKSEVCTKLWSFWSGNMGVKSACSSLSDAEAFSESENSPLRNGYLSPEPFSSGKKQFGSPQLTSHCFACSIWSRRGKQVSAPQILISRTKGSKMKTVQENVKDGPISRTLFHGVDDQEEEEVFTTDKENFTPNTHSSMRKMAVLKEAKHSNIGKSSLGKMLVSPDIYCENGVPPVSVKENVKDEVVSRTLFHEVDDQEEEEVFTPDKENFTPNTHRSMKKMAVLQEAKRSNSGKSSLRKPDMYCKDGMCPALDQENYSPQALQKQKTVRSASLNPLNSPQLNERRGERVPFQPLLTGSPQKSTSETYIPDAAIITGKSVICAKTTAETCLQDKCTGERTRKWNMVVDTATLLNKESRKALQLLAGLKGTQLVIPRIVIRELDYLKRQVSFFRRNSGVFSALEWIQDCMAKTHWWIHIQSTVEEGHPVAPTPPASPHFHFNSGTATSVPFLGFEPRAELISPIAEDHVLEFALCFSRACSDGQLVLLSDDITLKIKAMAEGIICEGAEEFRESLVNPFSERFLWADSSPRGQTWSCSDDIVLRGEFYPNSLKMTPKAMDNVKGLKLILLHNSQYFERMTALR